MARSLMYHPAKNKQLLIGNKIENNRPVSNYRHYRFIINRKQYGGKNITDVTSVTSVTSLIKKCCVAFWCGVVYVCVEMVVRMCMLWCVWCVVFCVCTCGVVCGCVHVVCGVGFVCTCGVVCGCVHVVCGVGVVCVHVLCVVCTCDVWCWCCVCTCGVVCCVGCVCVWCWCGVVCGEAWHAENPPVCTFKTPPCVRSGRLRVYRQRARMSKTGTHGDVLTVHTEAFWTYTQGVFSSLSSPLSLALSRSFLPLLFSSHFSLLFSSLSPLFLFPFLAPFLLRLLLLLLFVFPFYSLFSSLPFTPTNTVQSTDQQNWRPTSWPCECDLAHGRCTAVGSLPSSSPLPPPFSPSPSPPQNK